MKAEIYTWTYCPFCVRAKELLDKRGVDYDEHVMDGKDAELETVKRQYNHGTVPIVILDGEFVGGFSELSAVDAAGGLNG